MKIILLSILSMLFISCSDEKSAPIAETLKNEVTEVVSKEAVKTRKEIVKKSVEKIEVKKEVVSSKVVAVVAISGETIFKKCVSCHGKNAEKKALNKSQIIKGWASDKVVAALNGYKDGTYGGSMKGLMKAQVSKLSDEDVKKVSEYISKL